MEIIKSPLAPNACAPTLHIGTFVNYTDHKGKEVQGQIIYARAEWEGYGNGANFILKYAITHPASKNLQHHTISNIHGEVE